MAVKRQEEISLRYAQGEVFNSEKRFRVLVAEEGLGSHIYPVSNCLEEQSIDLVRFISIVLLLIVWQRILRGKN